MDTEFANIEAGMKTKELIHMKISLGSYKNFVENLMRLARFKQSSYVCVANVHMFVESYKSESFKKIVNNAVVVTPDGQPLTLGLRFLYGIKQERVAGMDLLPDLLASAEELKIPVAFYGGTQEMLDRTAIYLKNNYPRLLVPKLFSPPFRTLTPEEELPVIDMLNQSGAGIIFVVLGCPKQEKWMSSMQNRVQALMIGIGGALPVLVGMQKRSPVWMQRRGLEWLFRLSQEPRRLFKRYATTNSYFIYLLLKEKFSRRKRYDKSSSAK
jgi:N-acetylglucosaminyldiphosphoundecaprenol N-acetyl-beta-D-mannosaminyltransferase